VEAPHGVRLGRSGPASHGYAITGTDELLLPARRCRAGRRLAEKSAIQER